MRGGAGPGGDGLPAGARLRVAFAALILPLAAGCFENISVGLPDAAGERQVEIRLSAAADPGDVVVSLDGNDVTPLFAPGGPGLVGAIPALPPGPHRLTASLPFRSSGVAVDAPASAPPLLSSEPPGGGGPVPRTAWLFFELAAPPSPEALAGWGFGLECGGRAVASERFVVGETRVVVNPSPALPAGASCRAAWRDENGDVAELAFQVAADAAGGAASLTYDRSDPLALEPFPDDYWIVPDATRPSGRRVAVDPPPYPGLLGAAAFAVTESLSPRDGWSPVQPIVLGVSHPLDLSNLPESEAESLDPAGPIGLFDMDPTSPGYGKRVGFTLEARSDPALGAGFEHNLLLFPSRQLRLGGTYALAATSRLFAGGTPGRPLQPSAFLRDLILPPTDGEAPQLERARESVLPVLEFLAREPEVPLPLADVALALRISIRTEQNDPSDWVAVKEYALAASPPTLTVVDDLPATDGDRLLRGTISLPLYVTQNLVDVQRDPQTGAPIVRAMEAVPFQFRIPVDLSPPYPIVIYQHGSPGGPDEINGSSQRFLLDAGYALIGIQDLTNRRFTEDMAAQTLAVFTRILGQAKVPLAQFQTHADMFGLLRAVQGMGVPGNFPEIDTTHVFYRGISFGAHHSLGFLPFSPEITAAVSVVGGGRFFENTLHQIDFFDTLGGIQDILADAPPTLLIVGLAALQSSADRDDPQYLARHLYREPLAVDGQTDETPASLLWIEGVGDSIVSNTATRSAADELGIPQVRPVIEATSFQQALAAPVAGNLGTGVTGGHVQYLPTETQSCQDAFEFEGHFCAQNAEEAEDQILHFFATAAAGEAEIIDPFAR
jgi:hypothetical protein